MEWGQVYAWLHQQVVGNEFFAGGLVMGLVGWLVMVARDWPRRIGAFLVRQLTTELVIRSSDGEAFRHVALFLAGHPSRRHARRLGMVHYWEGDSWDGRGNSKYEVTFGFGSHVVWVGWTPVIVNRRVEESSGHWEPVQEISLTVPGRGHKRILDLIEKASRAKASGVKVVMWGNGEYRVVDKKLPRSIDSIVMRPELREAMVRDIRWFLENRQWYLDRGIPYRRGYMLEGPPGTGKSSTILALAGLTGLDVCIINPSSVASDNEMQSAFAEAGSNIVVLEDIDAIDLTAERAIEGEPAGKKGSVRLGMRSLSLSGLLNAIDGAASREGRIMFITSNRPEVLDHALIRPGRVDRRFHFDPLDRARGEEMWSRFFPGEDGTEFLDKIEWPISPADLQGRLLLLSASKEEIA